MTKLKIALSKNNMYYVFMADMAMNPDGPCVEVCDNMAELLAHYGSPVGYFTLCGESWAVLPLED